MHACRSTLEDPTEIVEFVRTRAARGPDKPLSQIDTLDVLRTAFAGRLTHTEIFSPNGLEARALGSLGPCGRIVAEVVRGALRWDLSWATASRVAGAVETHIRRTAHKEVRDQLNRLTRKPPPCGRREAVLRLLPDEDREELGRVRWPDERVPGRLLERLQAVVSKTRIETARHAMADFVRDVFGNPFRPSVIDVSWLLWNHGAVKHIAEQIATSGNFADLPILADALEEAGCTDAELLHHCRSETPHVPGCWAIDALMLR